MISIALLLLALLLVIALTYLVTCETGAWMHGRRPPRGWSSRDARRLYRRAFWRQ
jgi:hypothetical protein